MMDTKDVLRENALIMQAEEPTLDLLGGDGGDGGMIR